MDDNGVALECQYFILICGSELCVRLGFFWDLPKHIILECLAKSFGHVLS